MRKHIAEHLLRLLAHVAALCGTGRLSALSILRLCSALVWRLGLTKLALSPVALESKSSHPIEQWLSETITRHALFRRYRPSCGQASGTHMLIQSAPNPKKINAEGVHLERDQAGITPTNEQQVTQSSKDTR